MSRESQISNLKFQVATTRMSPAPPILLEVPSRLVNDMGEIRDARRARALRQAAYHARQFFAAVWRCLTALATLWLALPAPAAAQEAAPQPQSQAQRRVFVCGAGFAASGQRDAAADALHARCLEAVAALRAELDALHTPVDAWRWVVVAPAQWDRVRGQWGAGPSRILDRSGREKEFRPAFTALEAETTYVTAEIFGAAPPRHPDGVGRDRSAYSARARFYIAHERGHIIAQTRDEALADRIARALLAAAVFCARREKP